MPSLVPFRRGSSSCSASECIDVPLTQWHANWWHMLYWWKDTSQWLFIR